MKKPLLGVIAILALAVSSSAQAADMPTEMPVKAAPIDPPWSWTGLYVGGNVGYSWGKSDTDVAYATSPGGVPIVPPAGSITGASTNLDGAIAGGQIGYNWQNGNWVGGIEADLQWSGQSGSSNYLCAGTVTGGVCLPGLTFLPAGATGSALSLGQKLQWFDTLRGRLGFTPAPKWLVYATGGLAVGGIDTNAALASFTPVGVATLATASNSSTKAGWTVGVGVEALLSGHWTGKIEYLYMDYGTVSGSVINTPAGIMANYSSRITDNVLRAGLNYHF
jgi:outer membrane immunogenic protein